MSTSYNRTTRLTSRLDLRTAFVNLGAAVVGAVVVAVPALIQVSDRDGTIAARDATIDTLTQTVDTAHARLQARQEVIEALRAENVELRASLPYTITADDVPAIRLSATATLAEKGDEVDLNSIEPNFGAAQHTGSMDTLQYDDGVIELGRGISTLILTDGNARYESCAAKSGYSRISAIEPHLLHAPVGCLRLSTDRFAAIQITRSDAASAVVTITVWE